MSRFVFTVTTILAALTATSSLPAQDHEGVEQVGRIYNFWDGAYDIVVQEDYAYIAAGRSGLQIVDFFDFDSPEVVGYWDDNPGEAKGISISGRYAYLADGVGGLRVIDISEPAHPSETASCNTPGSAEAVFVVEDYAYIADGDSGLAIVDISDPNNPVLIASLDTPLETRDITVSEDYAYIVQSDGIRIIDIQTPEDPVEMGRIDELTRCRGVVVVEEYAFVAASDFAVIDITDPTEPVVFGQCRTQDCSNVAVSGVYACLTHGAGNNIGVSVVDISEPEEPWLVVYYEMRGYPKSVAVVDDMAFVADNNYDHQLRGGIVVLDISEPNDPVEAARFGSEGFTEAVAVTGDLVCIGNWRSGLRIVDASEPQNPVEVEYFEDFSFSNDIAVAGDLVYVAGGAGLEVIDVSNPEDIQRRGAWEAPWGDHCHILAKYVAVEGRYAYVVCDWLEANSGVELMVIDISDPDNPRETEFLHLQGWPWGGIAIADDYAYVSTERALEIIDVSDPENPTRAATYIGEEGWVEYVEVDRNRAYVSNGISTIQVLDISDPEHPEELGSYDVHGFVKGVTVSDGYAYAATSDAGLYVLNVFDPNHIHEVGYYDTPGLAHEAAVSGDLAFVADWTNLGIYDISEATGGMRQLTVSLELGWNMISINITPPEEMWEREEGPDVVLMMEQLRIDEDNHHIILMKDGLGWFYNPEHDFNNIPFWDLTEGYQVKVDEDVDAVWSGEPIPADADMPIEEDWNIVSYFPTYELDASAPDFYVLSPIIDHVLIAKDGDGHFMVPAFEYSGMPPWREGQGYQVKVDADVVLNYPEAQEERVAVAKDAMNQSLRDHWTAPVVSGQNMSLLVTSVKGVKVEEGDQIAAFSTDGNIVGVGKVDEDGRCGMAVWGDDPSNDAVDGLILGEVFNLKLWGVDTDIEYNLSDDSFAQGNDLVYQTNEFVALEAIAEAASPNRFYLSPICPNPFNSVAKISYGLPEAADIIIRVFDVTGRQVAVLVASEVTAGHHTTFWNARTTASGIYFVKIEVKDFSATRKVMLVK